MSEWIMSEEDILAVMESQETYNKRVESEGGWAALTLELVRGILELDPEKDEEYNDYALVDMIEQAIKYHRNHTDTD